LQKLSKKTIKCAHIYSVTFAAASRLVLLIESSCYRLLGVISERHESCFPFTFTSQKKKKSECLIKNHWGGIFYE